MPLDSAPIRALLVDDEPAAREGLRQLADAEPDVSIVGECGDGEHAVERLRRGGVDLVFLDVRMPGCNGIDVIERVGIDAMPEVVFVTAFGEFAPRAFELAALDFLTKPVARSRFRAALSRFRQRRREQQAGDLASRLEVLLATLPQPYSPIRLVARTGGRLLLVDEQEVDWIQAEGDYCRVHHGGLSHLLAEPLSSLEARLSPHRFVRAHRGLLVAIARIREVKLRSNGTALLVLRGGQELSVSRRCRPALEASLQGSPPDCTG